MITASCSTQQPEHVSSKGTLAFHKHMFANSFPLAACWGQNLLGHRNHTGFLYKLRVFWNISTLTHLATQPPSFSPQRYQPSEAPSQRLVFSCLIGTSLFPVLNLTPPVFVQHLNTSLADNVPQPRATSRICPLALMRGPPDQCLIRRVGQNTLSWITHPAPPCSKTGLGIPPISTSSLDIPLTAQSTMTFTPFNSSSSSARDTAVSSVGSTGNPCCCYLRSGAQVTQGTPTDAGWPRPGFRGPVVSPSFTSGARRQLLEAAWRRW